MRLKIGTMLLAGILFTQMPANAFSQESVPTKITGPELSALARSTIIALHQANITGNYTVLRDLGAMSFRGNNTSARLSIAFAPLRRSGIDLSKTVVFDPVLTKTPKIDRSGILSLEGFFPTKPKRINFAMSLRYEEGRWRIFSVSVGAGQPKEANQKAQQPNGETPSDSKNENSAANQMNSGKNSDNVIKPRDKPVQE